MNASFGDSNRVKYFKYFTSEISINYQALLSYSSALKEIEPLITIHLIF